MYKNVMGAMQNIANAAAVYNICSNPKEEAWARYALHRVPGMMRGGTQSGPYWYPWNHCLARTFSFGAWVTIGMTKVMLSEMVNPMRQLD